MAQSATKLLQDYASRVKKFELSSTLALVSFILTLYSVSQRPEGGFYTISFLDQINMSFFALIVKESWGIYKKNPLPLALISLSIILSLFW